MPDVNKALRSVQAATEAAQRAATRAAATAQKEQEKIADRQWQSVAKAAKKEQDVRTKAADAAAKSQIKAWQKADTEQKKAQDSAARRVDKQFSDEKRKAEAAARDTIRREEKTAREIRSIKEKSARDAARTIAKEDATTKRDAAKAKRAQDRANNQQASSREAFAHAIGGALVSGVGTGVSRVAGKAMQTAGMVTQLAGGFDIADSVQRSVSLKGKLADIASRDVTALGPDKTKRRSVGEMEGAVRGATGEFGIDASEGADALDKFASKTGELSKGMEMLRGIAQLSRAGAGSMADLSEAAGSIFNSDKTQSAEDVLKIMRGLSVQGAQGSVEMRDMAANIGKVVATAGKFKGGNANEILTLGSLAQGSVESGGSANAAQALTAVQSFGNQFGKGARIKNMERLMAPAGKHVKDDDGFNRPTEEILMDLLQGAETSSRKKGHGLRDFDVEFGTAIGDAKAQTITNPLAAAFKKAGGGEAGITAAKAQLAKFGAGGRDLKKEFGDTAASRMGEDDMKLAKVKADFDKAVSERIIPALMKLVPEIEKLVPVFVDLNAKAIPVFVDLLKSIADFVDKNHGLIDDIAQHPIGTLMAASVGQSIASAGLGELMKNLLSRAIGGGGGGGVAAPGGGGGSNVGAAVGAGAAAAAATYMVARPGVDAVLAGQTSGQMAAGDYISRINRGGKDRDEAMAEYNKMKDEYGGTWGASKLYNSYTNTARGAVYSAITGEKNTAAEETTKIVKAREILDTEGLKQAISDAFRQGAKEGASTYEYNLSKNPNQARGTPMTGRN